MTWYRAVMVRSLSLGILIFSVSALAQTPTISSVVNLASGGTAISPGCLAIIHGTNLTLTGAPLTVNLANNSTVYTAAVITSSTNTATQLTIQLPVNAPAGPSAIQVNNNGQLSSEFPVILAAYAPAILVANGPGTFQDDTTGMTAGNYQPARTGDVITMFAVGLGPTNPSIGTGLTTPPSPLSTTTTAVSVTVGGISALVSFAGLAPGQIGTYQVNFTIPSNAPLGTPNVVVGIGGLSSTGVGIFIQSGPPATIVPVDDANLRPYLYTQFQLFVQVKDAAGNLVAGDAITFSAPTTGASVTFANGVNTAVTGTGGSASITAFANGTPGAFNITVTDGISLAILIVVNNTAPSSSSVVLTTAAFPGTGGSVSPPSGAGFGGLSTVQVTAAENSGFTFLNWTGNVADPFATSTTSTFSSSETVTANFIPQSFTDVPPSSYQFDAVNLFSQQGITSGCGTGTYCPLSDVTRAEMAIFIVRAIEGGDSFTFNSTPYFTDVPSGSFGFNWIQKMYELGITSGCGATTFCPNATVTRAQMAIFIIRARYGTNAVFDYPSIPYFTDVPVPGFGFAWIQRLKEDGITSGCTPTTYCPNNPVIRGDMAIFIMKGAFNRLFAPATAVLISARPNVIAPGVLLDVTVTGNGTHFAQGFTTVHPMPGFTVEVVEVLSPTELRVSLLAGASPTAQPISLWITTSPDPPGYSFTEEVVLPNAVAIQGPPI